MHIQCEVALTKPYKGNFHKFYTASNTVRGIKNTIRRDGGENALTILLVNPYKCRLPRRTCCTWQHKNILTILELFLKTFARSRAKCILLFTLCRRFGFHRVYRL